jgi:hypothetical protein
MSPVKKGQKQTLHCEEARRSNLLLKEYRLLRSARNDENTLLDWTHKYFKNYIKMLYSVF